MLTESYETLANRAYEKWDNGSFKGLSYEEFVKTLPEVEKAAVLLERLIYQVCNGGFSLWIGNGYCVSITELIELVKQMKEPASTSVLLMLMQIEPYIQKNSKKGEGMENYVIPELINNEHPFWCTLHNYDLQFYAFKDCLTQEVETFMGKQMHFNSRNNAN